MTTRVDCLNANPHVDGIDLASTVSVARQKQLLALALHEESPATKDAALKQFDPALVMNLPRG